MNRGGFAVTADVVLFSLREGRFSVLLVRRGRPPYEGRWAFPGGFVELDEDLDEAALRELHEETGLSELPPGTHLEQLGAYGAPGRDPRMRVVSAVYVALTPRVPEPSAGDDAAAARFWAVSEVLGPDGPELAFDHGSILEDAVERVRSRIEDTPLAAAFLDEPFTLSALRAIYEEVWGERQDASNFRRKVLRAEGFVIPLGEIATPEVARGGRPADLYRRGAAKSLWPPLRRRNA